MGYAYGSIDDFGPGVFRKVRRALGVTAFGVNAMVLAAADRLVRALPRRAGRALLRAPRASPASRSRASASSSAPEASATSSRRLASARSGTPARRPSSSWSSAARAAISAATATWSTRPTRSGAAPSARARRPSSARLPSDDRLPRPPRRERLERRRTASRGTADRPLTELGRRQAEALAERLASASARRRLLEPVSAARCETAAIVAARHGLEPQTRSTTSARSTSAPGRASAARGRGARFPTRSRRWLDGGEGWEDGESLRRHVGPRRSPRSSRSLHAHPEETSWSSPTAGRSARCTRSRRPGHRGAPAPQAGGVNAKLSRLSIADGRVAVER